MFKLTKKILIMIILFALMVTMVTATAHAVNTAKIIDKKDTSAVKIESKSKTVNYKITWNANGGKIGTKKTVATTVKKGSKIKKLATSPKRNGYTFKGWYSKKTGGKKINKNTSVKKSISYYAQWKKVNTIDSRLLGSWQYENVYNPYPSDPESASSNYYYCSFNKDGRFNYHFDDSDAIIKGKYSASKGKIYFTNIHFQEEGAIKFTKYNKDIEVDYKFGNDSKGKYIKMPYFSITLKVQKGGKYRKM